MTTMQAVKISESTIPIILKTPGLTVGDVDVMTEFLEDHTRYFITNLTDEAGVSQEGHWGTVPGDTFWDWFVGDKEMAETEFVEVERNPEAFQKQI